MRGQLENKILKKLETMESQITALHQAVVDLNITDTKPDTEPEPLYSEGPVIDSLAHLRALEELNGLHESRDRDQIMDKFKEQGIEFDPSKQPWCGVAIRYAVVAAGYQDPGEIMHRATNWQDYGEECDPDEPGAILVHHTHVGIRTESGGELGGNVTDSVKVGQPSWFGDVIAARKPVV